MNSSDAPNPPPDSLTHATTKGYAYMLLQAIGTQIINFGGFIALGWLLTDAEFGLFALVMTVSTAASLIRQIGLRTILVKRYRHFRRWANPAFWLSLVLGFACGGLMIAATPFVERLYGEDNLLGLIAVMAAGMPFTAAANVPEAALQAELRFRYLSKVQFGFVVVVMAGTIGCALLGLGAYSLVIPRPLARFLQCIAFWWAVKPPIRLRPQIGRWRYMFADSAKLTVANVSRYVVTRVDYVMLGAFHEKAIVGVYFFAFALSQRSIVMLATNLRDVLFPVLSKIEGDPRRQAAAFLRASRLLAILGAPACLLQAAIAAPAFATVLPASKDAAVPVLQLLSFGMISRLVGQPSMALIRAQGRYGVLTTVSLIVAVTFTVAAWAGAALGEGDQAPITMAIAITIFLTILGPIQMYIAVAHGGAGIREITSVLVPPVTAALIAVGGAWGLGQLLPADAPLTPWLQLIVVPIVAMVFYVPVVLLICPTDAKDLFGRLMSLRLGRR